MVGSTGSFSRFSGVGAGTEYPDPFRDIASLSVPANFRSALYWSEHVYSIFGAYRMAMERVISYFLTDIEITGCDDDEKQKYTKFMTNTISAIKVTQDLLRDRMCFHGDTKAITEDGVFRLRDLVGKTVNVLSEGGIYRKAEFKSFGRQELLEVEFSDGRKVLATPDHEWVVNKSNGGTTRVPTTELHGRRITRTVAPRPEKNSEFEEGVRHGFVFGDGTLYNDGRQSCAWFFGAKDVALIPFFAGHGSPPISVEKRNAIVINGLPPHYKKLPETEKSASYWYGFLSGFLAADGSVDTHGCAVLTQKSGSTLSVIADQLPRIGMVGGQLRSHKSKTEFLRESGKIDRYDNEMQYLTLLKQFMRADDFLIPQHRENFEKNYEGTKYGQQIRIRDVRETGIVDEVFCCVEMDTHTFVIDNGVLTGNCYGNGFASVVVPFVRWLTCPSKGCGHSAPLKEIATNKHYKYEFQLPKFIASCPICKGKRAPWIVEDRQDDQESKIKVKLWSPHEIEILHCPISGDSTYFWRIPEDYKRQVKAGHLFYLERVPEEVLKAIEKNQVYRFNPDVIFHMKEPALSGITHRGWGIPRILSNFRQIWYVQVLRRFNEAIALDYVVPFRVITPAPAQGTAGGGMATDPLLSYNGADFRSNIMTMIRRRRTDPNAIQVSPVPLNFQMFGADAAKLAPRDLLDQGMEQLLNDVGTPVELYNGSLQLQAAPVALRLFESTWHHMVHDANMFLMWLVRQISQILSWSSVEAGLRRVTIADNLEKQMMAAQMMMSQQLSGTTVMRDMGYNWKQEQKQIAEEARFQAETKARNEEEMAQAGFAQQIAKGQQPGQDPSQGGGDPSQAQGAPPAAGGGDPSQGGGPVSQYLASMTPNTPVTPQDMMAVADSLAQQLLGLPESVKDSQLRQLKLSNPTLHSLVKTRMDQLRKDAKSQAASSQAMQQQPQGAQQQMAA